MRKYRAVIIFLLLAPVSYLLAVFCRSHTAWTEAVYSRRVYPVLSGIISSATGLIPFCAAEILLYILILVVLGFLLFAVLHIRRIRLRSFLRFLLIAACAASAGYFLFNVMWGLNYDREPLLNTLHYKSGPVTKQELAAVMTQQVDKINALCPSIRYRAGKGSYYPGGVTRMERQVSEGYEKLHAENALFNANTPHPKTVLASVPMAYAGIDGIFIPFTYEPCVNNVCPEFMLPSNMAHESAHFKGFAREEEANYLSYLANSQNSDLYFQYSAHLFAYIYLSNALFQTDESTWETIASRLDPRAAGDLDAYNRYVQKYSGPVQKLSQKVNDSYLKAQGQPGVVSYDLFVDLLAAQYRTQGGA